MKMTIRFYKLKQRCDKSNGSCNWNSTKSSSLHGTKLQVCEHFINPTMILLLLILLYFNEWNSLFTTMHKKTNPNSTHHQKGLVMYIKTMAQLPWIFMLHQNILQVWINTIFDTLLQSFTQKIQTCTKAIPWRLGVIHF